jgi:hypothetical protein
MKKVLPEKLAPAERLGQAREAQARRLAGLRPQLVEPEVRRQPLDRLAVHDDQERHDDRPRPIRDFVDVEQEERRRQEHDLGRHRRHAVPVVLAEERQQDLGEDVGLDRPAHLADALAGRHHRRVVHAHAGQLHREVGLDRRREVGRPGLEEVEAAVGLLPPAQVADHLGLALAVDPVDQVAEE